MRRQTLALLAFLALLPAAAIAGGLAIPTLQALLALGSVPYTDWPQRLRRAGPALIVMGACLALLVARGVWPPLSWAGDSPAPAIVVAATGIVLALGAAEAPARDHAVLRAASGAALAVSVGLALFEAATGSSINALAQPGAAQWKLDTNPARGMSVWACAAWPAALGLAFGARARRRFWALLAGALAAAVGMLCLQFSQTANALAFAAGLGAAIAAYAAPGIALRSLGGIGALWMLGFPWATRLLPHTPDEPYSWAARLQIWEFALARIAEKPFLGWGFGASRSFPDSMVVQGRLQEAIPLHPHSAAMQVWLELGAAGALLFAALFICVGWRLAGALGADRPRAAAAAGAIAAFVVISGLSYGAWQSWWLAVPATCAIMILAMPRSDAGEHRFGERERTGEAGAFDPE